jgi:hypothetical protein
MLGVIRARPGFHRLQGNRQEAREIGVHQRGDAARQDQSRIAPPSCCPDIRKPVVKPRHRNQHADRDHRPGTA